MKREPQALGFYPAEPSRLEDLLDRLLSGVEGGKRYGGGIVPHAGYMYSGLAAAALYKNMNKTSKIILVGNDHYGSASVPSTHPYSFWKTPLGEVEVDKGLADGLGLDMVKSPREHSIEVQLPFLQHLWGEFSFLPITVPRSSLPQLKELGRALAEKGVPIVATTDLSHHVPQSEANRLDQLAIDRILEKDPEGLLQTVDKNNISMCGVYPTIAAMYAMQDREPELLAYYTSGDITDREPVVGYASIGFR